MKKTLLFFMPLAITVAACGSTSIDDDGCIVDTRPMRCKGDPKVPMVNLNTNTMKVNPRCVKANPGTTIVFRLTPRNSIDLNTIEISPKDDADAADDWLEGSNDIVKDLIIVSIPEEIGEGDYHYAITTPDKCKDPRVRVQD